MNLSQSCSNNCTYFARALQSVRLNRSTNPYFVGGMVKWVCVWPDGFLIGFQPFCWWKHFHYLRRFLWDNHVCKQCLHKRMLQLILQSYQVLLVLQAISSSSPLLQQCNDSFVLFSVMVPQCQFQFSQNVDLLGWFVELHSFVFFFCIGKLHNLQYTFGLFVIYYTKSIFVGCDW